MIDWNKDIIGNKKTAGNLDKEWTREEATELKSLGFSKQETFDSMEQNAILDDYIEMFQADKEEIINIIDEVYNKA